jgi:hypothetical protein
MGRAADGSELMGTIKRLVAEYVLGRLGVYSLLLFLFSVCLCAALFTLSFLSESRYVQLLYISVPLAFCSAALFLLDVVVLRNLVLEKERIRAGSVAGKNIVVGMTAYNDEQCIAGVVRDFLGAPGVTKVIVVDNNCTDRTRERAAAAGAEVVSETRQGYGYACMRALEEAAQTGDIMVLVEGDATFSAGDLKKFLPYLENCDMVAGTRTTKELNDPDSQLDGLMALGNVLVAKLLQTRFWGTRFTDVGCTYRAVTKESYEKFRGALSVGGMHFLPHMMIQALKSGIKVIEVPITFRKRAGESKGVGSNKVRAASVGLKMIFQILFS